MLGAPGAVHPDPSQGADERAPAGQRPHLSVRPKQGRRWPARSRRRRAHVGQRSLLYLRGWQVGPADPRGPLSAIGMHAWVESRVDLAVLNMDFQKGFKKWFSDFYLNALGIYNFLKMAPNLLKQILLCFLSPDLHDKNIACHFWDTFLWSFI